jgi:hypothetical protein
VAIVQDQTHRPPWPSRAAGGHGSLSSRASRWSEFESVVLACVACLVGGANSSAIEGEMRKMPTGLRQDKSERGR